MGATAGLQGVDSDARRAEWQRKGDYAARPHTSDQQREDRRP